MKQSRTMNSIKNVFISIMLQLIVMVFTLLSRTVFVKLLGNEYLSVNGLFANIITLLSFTELGIGNAIIFSLYKPISENDEKKICGIMNLYSKAYKYIFIIIIFIGISIIPFLKYIIDEVPNVKESINFIYILFLLNTAFSYVFSYKKSLLIADQKNYLVTLIHQIVFIVQIIIQIGFLVVTHNYIAFLIIQLVATVLTNIVTTIYIDKKYEYINKYKGEKIDYCTSKEIISNIKSICFYKLGAVILNGTDNIIISTIIKTTFVGLCSNYILVINAINSILMQACNSIAATIGNHNVEAKPNEKEEVFNMLYLISYWVFALATICLAVLLNPLIELWLGDKYLLDSYTVITLVFTFYLTGINQIPALYRTSMGIFKQARLTPIIASIINLVLSVILGKKIGLVGIFIATAIAKLITFCTIDPILVYNKGFRKSSKRYFKKFVLMLFLLIITYIISIYWVSLINLNGAYGLILKATITFLNTNTIFYIIFFRTKSFKKILNVLKSTLVAGRIKKRL